jgi:hypothetical protein
MQLANAEDAKAASEQREQICAALLVGQTIQLGEYV